MLHLRYRAVINALKGAVLSALQRTIRAVLRLVPARLVVLIKANAIVVRPMDYQKGQILLCLDSDLEYKVRLNSCRKEPDTVAWIERFFEPGDVFFDIGANVGAYSLVASQVHGRCIRVYAFEPSAINFAQLVRNIALNRFQDIILPVPIALSDCTKIQVLSYHDMVPGGALHCVHDSGDSRNAGLTPIFCQSVLTFRLDDIIDQFTFPTPAHIKIDVDGNEPRVLAGAARTIQNSVLRSVLVEVDELRLPETQWVSAFLAERGLHLHSKYTFETGPNMRLCNCIFSRKRPESPPTIEQHRTSTGS